MFGEKLFNIYTKDEPTFKELDSVQNVCETNIILFKIDCEYKTKLLFSSQPTLIHSVIEDTGILKKLCKYLFTNQCSIMDLWHLVKMFDIPNETNTYCKSKQFSYTSIL